MNVADYESARAYLGTKAERPIANNTRLVRRADDRIAVRLHATDVVTYCADGTAELNSGGWLTVTTKDRINGFSPARVYSDRGVWHVYKSGEAVARFFDGIRVNEYGEPINAPSASKVEAQERAERAMVRRIREFVRGYMGALREGMPVPGAGDCFFCSMFDRAEPRPEREHYGFTVADSARAPLGGDPEHLLSHLDESYYVPSLAVNALRYIGARDTGIGFFLGMRSNSERMGEGRESRDAVSRALTRYLKARLVPGLAR